MITPALYKNTSIVECPICGSSLNFKDKSNNRQIELLCSKCNADFPFENGSLNLIPPKIRAEICAKGILTRKIKDGFHLGKLTKDEHDLISGILASDNMAKQYFRNVVHPTDAAWSARSYERFEDIFVIQYLDKLLKDKKVVFIDAGSGPGRYLLLLGSKISADSCKELKKNPETGILYRYDSSYERNLSHIIGIDYSMEMTSHSAKLLRRYGLGYCFYDRIFPINGIVQNFHLNHRMFEDTYKVIVCTFQTLGNQENHDLQVQLLKSMKNLAKPHGTIIVSVFNKKLFKSFGLKTFYGREVKKTVGDIVTSKEDEDNFILRTTKGVYSKWFSKGELEGLFKEAGLTNYSIMDEDSLSPISGYEQYLKKEEQEREVFPRAILGLAEIGHEDK
ncbi:MAG: methyltransferase domain-containing protein [Thaumarchaeota archaeon]|nr:methyltransferase domain-containing protein [Nitrososphaerota archaeon]